MAEAAEITPSEESLLTEKLSIGKVEYDVDLTSSVLRFTKNIGKGKPPVHRIIQLEDILNVQLSDKPDEPCLTLCFIERVKPYWKSNNTIFRGKDKETCQRIAEKVMSAVAQKTPNRPKKLLIVINPKSGGCKGQRIFERQVLPLLQLAEVEVKSLITERAGHGGDYVQDFDLASVDGVLVVGGDGTLAEIINGLYRRKCKAENINIDDKDVELPPLGIKIGIIPAGTGQGIAMNAYGVVGVETAVLQCIKGATHPLTVYSAHNGGKCLMIGDLLVSYGLFSYAIAYCEARRDLGRLRYGVGMAKAIWKVPRFTAEIQYKLEKSSVSSQTDDDKSKDDKGQGSNGAASNLEEGWESVSGEYTDVNTFMIMKPRDSENYPPGTVILNLIDTTSRINFLKFGSKLMKMMSSEDLDFMNCKYVTAYRVILKEMPNPEHKDAITVVNLDGDPFPLTDTVLHVKTHGDVLTLYGTRPGGWQQGILKKVIHGTTN